MPALRVLAVQNNNFSGPIPVGLLSPNSQIQFTYDGNPFLGNQSSPASPKCRNCGKSNVRIIAGASVGAVVGLLAIVAILLCIYGIHKYKISDKEDRANRRIVTPAGVKAYSYAEVTAMTNHFSRKLGEGGFGPVYYGVLACGKEVAVKVARGDSELEEPAFVNEVGVLLRVYHKNIVALVGYSEEQKQILIYEYMHNGSLFDHLHGNSNNASILNWRTRLNIALNGAQEFEAKLADFGITKFTIEREDIEREDIRVSTEKVVGTFGYLDPEYSATHFVSSKSDVYSFGVVLLELIIGSRPNENSPPNERNPNIVNWVHSCLDNNDITSIMAPAVEASNPNMEAVKKVVDVAMQSVKPKGEDRPTMSAVVQELQGALALETANA